MPFRTRIGRGFLGLLAFLTCALAVPTVSAAADTVYWTSAENAIGFASLDGSGGGNLPIGGARPLEPSGLAIDSATGRIYWANRFGSIGFANLDGSGDGDLNTQGAPVSAASGLAIDPVGRRIYWTNTGSDRISFANLDGSGGGNLTIGGASVDEPTPIAVDPVAGRLYWGNGGDNTISFANLDGSGGGTVPIGGGAVHDPTGIAVDTAAQRVYWTNFPPSISSAKLDGSDVKTAATPLGRPIGIALDPDRGRIYWADQTNGAIGFGNLDNTGGDKIDAGAANKRPFGVALLESPKAAGPPAISGGPGAASVLSCSPGTWVPDLVASSLFRAPHTFAYRWTRNGSAVPGATQSTLMADPKGGDFQCQVTAENHAGSATQTSATVHVDPAAFGLDAKVTLTLASRRVRPRGPIRVLAANANAFPVTVSLSAQARKAAGPKSKRIVKFGETALSLPAQAESIVSLRLPRSLQQTLVRAGKLKVALSATFADPIGNGRALTQSVVPKLQAEHRHH